MNSTFILLLIPFDNSYNCFLNIEESLYSSVQYVLLERRSWYQNNIKTKELKLTLESLFLIVSMIDNFSTFVRFITNSYMVFIFNKKTLNMLILVSLLFFHAFKQVFFCLITIQFFYTITMLITLFICCYIQSYMHHLLILLVSTMCKAISVDSEHIHKLKDSLNKTNDTFIMFSIVTLFKDSFLILNHVFY